ncbi:site-specific DNA-methyltransferase [Acinetobacter indicus]|uniref:site-specific DNA-methyltransferase n=1 Tax=Acinetobacter indicus TaxID=756892 RepID=UPI00143FFFCB|nr:site-specific DNA-methyltransferase [Acinetobacter indicus]QIZ57702.1 site-specific DNA-methyltransferase [Acinetobacter indicus]
MDTALIQTLKKILKQFPKFWNGENLQRSLVIDAIQKKEADLVKALINNSKIKSIYSTDVDGVLIFEFEKLISLLKYKEYWADSFTKYRNNVGLTSEGKYLDYSSDVVLDFPFKDCVLEGGMTKEDQGKDEIYYNEIIARDEIDRLFSPKVFTNSKRYTENGVQEDIAEFTNQDNLIIKGNNLIALHSVKERYAGSIDLIYIDPPFNTEHDSFKYNDKFNESTWLTFMKNRLEIARDLLSVSGTIYVHIDHNEGHYLKVLMDEIFGRQYFRNEIIWRYSGWNKKLNYGFEKRHDSIFVYAKSDSQYFESYFEKWASKEEYVKKRKQKLLTDTDGREYVLSDAGGGNRTKVFIEDVLSKGVVVDDVWDIDKLNNSAKESVGFASQKKEALLERIISASCPPNGIVLDFHLGSGTTCAAAHKMGRRYIGIEQMDYINETTVPRLQKVIEGEQNGISKNVSWQGGGSFVYTELMELNYLFIHQIEQAKTTEQLLHIFEVMKVEAHLNYHIALDRVLNNEYEIDGINHLVTFNELELTQQKHLLIEVLDKNQLYVNFSEIDDQRYAISESDKAFTTSFYHKD